MAHPYTWTDEEPPTGVFLGDSGDNLDLLKMPGGATSQRTLALPDFGPGAEPVAQLLTDILAALRAYRVGHAPVTFPVTDLSDANRSLLDQTLGEGEVGIVVSGGAEYQIRESVLAGLWRVRTFDVSGRAVADHVEIADVPAVVRAAALGGTVADLPIGEAPADAMNALPVLAELRHRMTAYRPGERNHVISFTLLPMNEADMGFLRQSLGNGPVQAVSRGYGTCRVTATGRRHIWSVQFLNAMDTVILDTLEIGDVPVAVTAANEDFEDSAERLAEILEAYFV
jgi:hydrogenase-1 operon protein HyaF